MKNLKDAKDIYDHIVVPEELDARLRSALETATPQKHNTSNVVHFSKWAATAAAALFLCFTIGLNTSESFAVNAAELPLLGQIAKVLTIRSYEKTEGNTTTTVVIPEIQLEPASSDEANAITDVNQKIQSLVEEFTLTKEAEVEEYKNLFLENGGTLEEWEERSIDINVDYEVKYKNETTLSLLIDSWISWFNFEEERQFYNLDLTTGKELTLKDFFGEDAYTYASDCVLQQMEALIESAPDTYSFWGVNEGEDVGYEFIGVTEETLFYINENGKIVVTYDKYEVAPGSMGIQEFVIPAR